MQKTATKTISAERFTPVTLARKLDARVLLESASFMKGRERYSILLVREAFCVRETSAGVFLVRDGTETRLPDRSRTSWTCCARSRPSTPAPRSTSRSRPAASAS